MILLTKLTIKIGKYLLFTSFISLFFLNNLTIINQAQPTRPILDNWNAQELKIFAQASVSSNQITTDKPQNLQIDYQIIGSNVMENASLHIRLSRGISIVPNSIYDTFAGKDIKVSTDLFDTKNNQLIYGPSSGTLPSSNLNPGDKGQLRLQITVTDPTITNYAMISYILDTQSKIVQPSIINLKI